VAVPGPLIFALGGIKMRNSESDGGNLLVLWLVGLVVISAVLLAIAFPLFDRWFERAMVVFCVFLYLLRGYLLIERHREENDLPKDWPSLLWLLGPGVFLSGGDLFNRRKPEL